MTFKITLASLAKLSNESVWLESSLHTQYGFTTEDVYGPEGKLNWLWSLRWKNADAMRSDLCTNMGGGVPIEIIDSLIEICVRESWNS